MLLKLQDINIDIRQLERKVIRITVINNDNSKLQELNRNEEVINKLNVL